VAGFWAALCDFFGLVAPSVALPRLGPALRARVGLLAAASPASGPGRDARGPRGWLLDLVGQSTLLERNPALARSIRLRLPYIEPLNHLQVELLRRHRSGDADERVRESIHLTINGIAAGLRNTG